MKTRNGFVSNSSSSSFIVAFPFDNQWADYEQVNTFLDHKKVDYGPELMEWSKTREYLLEGIEHYFFEVAIDEIKHTEYLDEYERNAAKKAIDDRILENIEDLMDEKAYYKAFGSNSVGKTDAEREEIYEQEKKKTKQRALSFWSNFKSKHPRCIFLRFSFEDHGAVEGHMYDRLIELAQNKKGDVIVVDYH